MGGVAATSGAGTDFAWLGTDNPGWPDGRGIYHNSNIGRIRHFDPGCYESVCSALTVPLYSAAMNDLLWAEGLIRGGGSATAAAALINKTRAARGGLLPLTGAESVGQLLSTLQYEQEVELMDFGGTVFYNRRRIDGLKAFTPRQMLMPYKELGRLRRELYSYGGAGGPDMGAPAGVESNQVRIPTAIDINRSMHRDVRRAGRPGRR